MPRDVPRGAHGANAGDDLAIPIHEVEAVRRFTGKNLAGFLQKPYSAITLAQKVASILREPRGAAES